MDDAACVAQVFQLAYRKVLCRAEPWLAGVGKLLPLVLCWWETPHLWEAGPACVGKYLRACWTVRN